MVKLVNLNPEVQKKGNAEAYHVLSDIINEEIKQTDFKVFEYFPKQVALFSFYRNFTGKFSFFKNLLEKSSSWISFWTDSEPLFMDGGPPYPHMRVLNNNYMEFAERIRDKYKEKSGIEMTIEYAI